MNSKFPQPFSNGAQGKPESDDYLRLEPEDEADDQPAARAAFRAKSAPPLQAQLEDACLKIEPDQKPAVQATSAARVNGQAANGDSMCDALRWALDSMHHPSMASADWLARDIDPAQSTAADLLSNPQITLAQVRQAKTVFKTMRIVGEKSADRRVGARMYAAAIAAGLVRHDAFVSTQSYEAMQRAFQGLLDDRRMPTALRDLAGLALCVLKEKQNQLNERRSQSA